MKDFISILLVISILKSVVGCSKSEDYFVVRFSFKVEHENQDIVSTYVRSKLGSKVVLGYAYDDTESVLGFASNHITDVEIIEEFPALKLSLSEKENVLIAGISISDLSGLKELNEEE
ncbi:MAG: hypothetical protein AAGJ81_04570 [Verrucomicrobiota bacterium]